ncbi:NAD-binding Rossmann fold oxidoreductase [Vararia minispora EC-137]|uniref:NAD-binding Rossmann fold oxidoreductase n=1 Tax=Vararia minispora EC-137 TaxID=1314806 RepID=A0ACB8Q8U8_9AGAM|nr:NAD-binding Rossmann fold oxidoreductase [Vararia minispora EC-137]
MPIRLGVVGLSKNSGWAASNLIPPIFSQPLSDKLVLTAVSTSSPASASASAAHFGELAKREVKGYHGSTEAISSDPDVDVVVVSVKVTEHLKAVMPAIHAGKDVFVEWPLGKNLAEGKAIADAARERGVRTMIGLQSWQAPLFAKVKEWVRAGKIGRVISTSWFALKVPEIRVNAPVITPGMAFYSDPANGGTYLDIPIAHNFSAIMPALGRLRRVSATTVVGFPEVKVVAIADSDVEKLVPHEIPDQFAVSGVFESGALFSGTWLTLGKALTPGHPTFVWEIVGTEGKIRVESDTPWVGFGPGVHPPETVFLNGERVSFAEENAAQTTTGRAWEAFASGVQGSYPTFEDALELHRLVEAVKKSSVEGRAVDVDEI